MTFELLVSVKTGMFSDQMGSVYALRKEEMAYRRYYSSFTDQHRVGQCGWLGCSQQANKYNQDYSGEISLNRISLRPF